MTLTKVPRVRASDAVLNVLRESILNQTFHPGQRLDVRELGEKLDVSLTPVKEAITRLVSEGLIELRPRSGTYVTRISPQDIKETLAVRRSLECLAGETLFDHMTEDDLTKFEEIVALLDRPIKTERERQQHERKNNEFHQRIVELSRNKKLIELYNTLNSHIKMARIHYVNEISSDRYLEEGLEHRAILAALQARDRAGLVTALNHHITRAAEALVCDLEKVEQNRQIR